MKLLTLEQTRKALPYDKLIDALKQGFCQEVEAPLRHHHFLENGPNDKDVMLLMPSWLKENWGGVKIVNVVPGNSKRGLASISSSYILFNRLTGKHELILDGGELTARRTAAASALAASYLAKSDSKIHLVIGAGRVGQNIPFAYKNILNIEETLVYNKSKERGEQMVSNLIENGLKAKLVTELTKDIVEQADVITCATLSKDPILKGEWLRPGQHIDLIGSFTPEMREVDDEAIRKSQLYVDTEAALIESGDIAIPIAAGIITENDILANLHTLCQNNIKARKSDDEITLFKGVGTAVEDLSAAILAYDSVSSNN